MEILAGALPIHSQEKTEMHIARRQFAVLAGGLLSQVTRGTLAQAQEARQDGRMGWRINNTASAWATEPNGAKRLKITLKGSGTFSPWRPDDVTGGGEYEIANAGGDVIENGEYKVTALVSYQQSPGSGPVAAGTVVPLLPNAVELRLV